ncbi:MAG: DNA mismatch repair endonuclease MutL [Desulfobacteraceae bacterium]|jgi:DNA mismatch repair protein MutL
MGKIKILHENVANQIAAGEVIERPASVVRELLDNSIDSGADRINIRIEEGGIKLIKVSDNGSGMDRDDMLLAVERHATSKISSVSDIFSIKTLGFRGEALPSICSVARTEIVSRIPDQISATRMRASGGAIESVDETGAPAGTSVEVRDLYYNTPARKKFLKTIRTETGQIVDAVSRIALPFTGISIKLLDNSTGKTLLNLPSSDNELNRLTALFGKDTAVSLMDARFKQEGLVLRAYLALPEMSRTRGDRMYVYVNNRNIRDKLIIGAITRGYGQRLMKGRYPQVALFMDIDPAIVDVNVHPAKQEVRFEDSGFIYKSVASTIAQALGDQLNPFSSPGENKPDMPIIKPSIPVNKEREPAWEYSPGEPENKAQTEIKESAFKEQTDLFSRSEIQYNPENKPDLVFNKPEVKNDTLPSSLIHTEKRQEFTGGEIPQVIGQLKGTYLLFQERDGLLMIDQHAAHERIVYETLKAKYATSKVESQNFLLPVDIELSIRDARILESKLEQLTNLGFEIENFGGNSFLIRAVPAILVNSDWENFLKDLIPVLEGEDDLTNDRAMDKLLTVMACHGAIRAGHSMSNQEMTLLIEQLRKLDLPANCPHGRPVFKRFSYYEIEKMFKRIV